MNYGRVPFIDVRGRTVFYELAGPRDAPVVVLGNSLGTSVHVWDAVHEGLATSFCVLRYDMRGHGLTGVGPGPVTMPVLAADVADLLDALGIARVRYVGLSIGGMIGQALAAAHPDRIDALVLCATASRIGTPEVWNPRIAAVRAGGVAAVRDGVLERWFTPATHASDPDLVRGFGIMLERTPAEGYAAACEAIRDADLAADDARIACPVLAIAGADDPVTPPADAFALRDAIRGARADVIPGVSHIFPAERPDAFLRLAVPFLRGAVLAGARSSG